MRDGKFQQRNRLVRQALSETDTTQSTQDIFGTFDLAHGIGPVAFE